MQITIFDVPERKMREAEYKFSGAGMISGKNDDGLWDLLFKSGFGIRSYKDEVAIDNKENITYFDSSEYSIIKII